MHAPERFAVLLTVILAIWGACHTPPGIVRHILNRLSIIGVFVSIGMGIGCLAIEASGYLLPFEGWIGGFLVWLFIFCLIYSRTRPECKEPPAETPDAMP